MTTIPILLEVAIVLTLVYALTAAIVSGLNEYIAKILQLRGKQLLLAIADLFGESKIDWPKFWEIGRLKIKSFSDFIRLDWWDFSRTDKWNEALSKDHYTKNFFGSDFIKRIRKEDQGLPFYVDSRDFTQAIISLALDDQIVNDITQFKTRLYKLKVDLENLNKKEAEISKLEAELILNGVSKAEDQKKKVVEQIDEDKKNIALKKKDLKLPDRVINQMLTIANTCENMAEFENKVGIWFDNYMDRVSGWYQKKVWGLGFTFSLIICFCFNIDTIEIIKYSFENQKSREANVAFAEKINNANQENQNSFSFRRLENDSTSLNVEMKDPLIDSISKIIDTNQTLIKKHPALFDALNKTNKKLSESSRILANASTGSVEINPLRQQVRTLMPLYLINDSTSKLDIQKIDAFTQKLDTLVQAVDKQNLQDLSNSRDTLAAQIANLYTLDLPLGWKKEPDTLRLQGKNKVEQRFIQAYNRHLIVNSIKLYTLISYGEFWLKLLGLIISTGMVVMGAPFWFDLLNNFINFRNAGVKPKKQSDKP